MRRSLLNPGPRSKLRQAEVLREERPVLLQEAHRVLREALERLGETFLLLLEAALEFLRRQLAACGKARAVAVEARPADDKRLPFPHVPEEPVVCYVDQGDAASDELERARVREAPGQRRGDVHDDADAALEELLRRDAGEAGVVDDGDVVGAEALDKPFRALVEARRSLQLNEHPSPLRIEECSAAET